MWFSSSRRLLAVAVLAAAVSVVVSGCSSFQPVYGSGTLSQTPSLNLAYDTPDNRLEQVVYQELALRLGSSSSPDAPLVRVDIRSDHDDQALSDSINPNRPKEVTVTATLTIRRRDGVEEAPLRIVRMTTASYTRNGQVLADRAAAAEASERASKAVAESLRLAILAALSRG
jgi:hypothetical protein